MRGPWESARPASSSADSVDPQASFREAELNVELAQEAKADQSDAFVARPLGDNGAMLDYVRHGERAIADYVDDDSSGCTGGSNTDGPGGTPYCVCRRTGRHHEVDVRADREPRRDARLACR